MLSRSSRRSSCGRLGGRSRSGTFPSRYRLRSSRGTSRRSVRPPSAQSKRSAGARSQRRRGRWTDTSRRSAGQNSASFGATTDPAPRTLTVNFAPSSTGSHEALAGQVEGPGGRFSSNVADATRLELIVTRQLYLAATPSHVPPHALRRQPGDATARSRRLSPFAKSTHSEPHDRPWSRDPSGSARRRCSLARRPATTVAAARSAP